MSHSSIPEKTNSSVISDWRPEDPEFWQQRGHRVASRNLWISVPCLLLAFCVWMLFSAVAVNLNKVGFQFTTDQLFMLTALPALSGALLRVPYAFMVPLFGGRRWTAFSTGIMIVPCVWLGFAVQDTSTPFSVFVIISLLCGFAGANFASSMANISFFFPKQKQGGALGINGGLGNMGVSVMQLVAPLVVSLSIFAVFGGTGSEQPDGSMLYLENAAWIWVPFLIIFTLAAWFFMNDLSASKASLSEQLPVVLFDRHINDSALPLVITDSITPTTELVADIARQHPDEFYFLGGQPRLSPTRDRLEGFKQGLREADVALRPEWIIHGNYHPSSGYEMFAELGARLGRPPKALFAAACGLLEGVLRYMGQHNLLQSDIRLASFDDHYLYDSLTIPVDTIRQDNRQLAWHCFDLISKLIEGETPQPLQRKLNATLQRRYKSAK